MEGLLILIALVLFAQYLMKPSPSNHIETYPEPDDAEERAYYELKNLKKYYYAYIASEAWPKEA